MCIRDSGEALMAQLAGHDDVADLHIAAALGRMGLVDARALAAAAQSPCVDRDWLLPPLVMRVSERVGKTEAAAAEVAEGLLTAERTRPGAIALCLAELGIPSRSSWESPEHSARDAAAVLGVDTPPLTRRKGSQRRHAQRVIRTLLAERTDAGAALLKALAHRDDALATRLVYLATWLALYAPGDAVADVIHRHGGLDARRLSDARRAVSSEHQPLLAGALDHGLEKAAILAHHLDGHPLADDVIEYLARHDIAHRIDLFLGVHAAWQVPARVPELLAQESTMALGLMLATWLPTLEVLEALLA